MSYRRGGSHRGAIRLGLADVVVIAIVMAILLFASWKQFPAYERPFTPRRILTPASRLPAPGANRLAAPQTASQP
jgi:hypothetical protein